MAGAGRPFQGQGQGAGRFGSFIARENRFSQYVDLQTPARYRLETPLDIVGATVVIPQPSAAGATTGATSATMGATGATTSIAPSEPASGGIQANTPSNTGGIQANTPGNTVRLDSPLMVNASTLNSTLVVYLDETSTSPSTTIVGRINLNEAPYEVIAGIPGLSQTAARSIVNRREQQANGMRDLYRQPTWLLAYNIVDLATLKRIWPHVTCGGDVFRGQVISFYEDIGTFSRVDAAVDATVFPPRLIDSKDLTSHGIGFHDRVLFGNIPRQSPGGIAVGSTGPTLADRNIGGSLTDRFPGMGMGTQQMSQQPFVQSNYGDIAPLEIPR